MARKESGTGFWYQFFDILFNIVVIVAIVGGVRTFLVSPFQVEGHSMVETLEDREYIIINKLAYFVGAPVRGDIVVFRPPTDHTKYYVKRVIGTPGDQVIIQGGFVYVRSRGEKEAVKLEEAYLSDRNDGHTYRHPPQSGDTSKIVYDVPEGKYFLLGDNRMGSLDSRSFMDEQGMSDPFVAQKDIKGRVWFVALPLSKVHAFEPPDYGL